MKVFFKLKSVMQISNKISADYYPETLLKLVITNAGESQLIRRDHVQGTLEGDSNVDGPRNSKENPDRVGHWPEIYENSHFRPEQNPQIPERRVRVAHSRKPWKDPRNHQKI